MIFKPLAGRPYDPYAAADLDKLPKSKRVAELRDMAPWVLNLIDSFLRNRRHEASDREEKGDLTAALKLVWSAKKRKARR